MRKTLAFALAIFVAVSVARAKDPRSAQSQPSSTEKVPPTGMIYVDITTDKTGAVERAEFINNVSPRVQEWIRGKIMGKHFGVPNHTYRRCVEYHWHE